MNTCERNRLVQLMVGEWGFSQSEAGRAFNLSRQRIKQIVDAPPSTQPLSDGVQEVAKRILLECPSTHQPNFDAISKHLKISKGMLKRIYNRMSLEVAEALSIEGAKFAAKAGGYLHEKKGKGYVKVTDPWLP